MRISDSTKVKLLSLATLTLLSIILLFVAFRLFFAIVNVFVYFVGLVTLFCSSIIFVGVIIFMIYMFLIKSKRFKRINFSCNEVLDICISILFKVALFLLLIDLILFVMCCRG